MKKVLFFIFSFCIIFLNYSYSFTEISLGKFKESVDSLKINNYSSIEFFLKKTDIDNQISTKKCNYRRNGNTFYLSPLCILNNDYPTMDIEEALELVWPYINGFDNIYDLNSKGFYYYNAKPQYIWDYKYSVYIKDTWVDDFVLSTLESKGYFFKVPKEYIAFHQVSNYSYYISDKSLTYRYGARLQNFNVAMRELNDFVLQPQQELYFNKMIANKPGYSNPNSKYLFNGGVCGVSTMLFRNSLLNPSLYITERYNHAERYVNFYSPYLYGDDASVYQRSKRLKIKNTSDVPVYFKKKIIGKKIYLVTIIPKKVDDFVYVKKEQTSHLTATVGATVFDKNGEKKSEQFWNSKYIKRNYSN